MDLLAPAALWWLLALGVLLLLPRIRLPRTRRLAAALHLWIPSDADEHPRPAARLRRHRSLILQALAIVALVAALAGPTIFLPSRTLAVVVDVSASMGAVDGGGTRLDTARRAVLSEVATLPLGSRVRLFSAGETVESHGEFGPRSGALRSALDALVARESAARLDNAIETAKAIADADVLVVSDTTPRTEDGRVRWRQVGTTTANVALTAFGVRRLPDSALDAELIVEVSNYSAAPVSVPLVIAGPAGDVHRRQVPLSAWESRVVEVPVPGVAASYTARIEHQDALTTDNVRTTALTGVVARVALEGSPSSFTRAALAVNPSVTLVDDPADANVIVCGGCATVPAGTANVLVTRAEGVRRLDRRHPVAAAVAPFGFAGAATVESTRRVLRLGVDDEDARLVRDAVFPLLIAASVEWLVAGPAKELPPKELPPKGGSHGWMSHEWMRGESDLRVVPAPANIAPSKEPRRDQSSPLLLTMACLVAALLFLALDWLWAGGRSVTPAVVALRVLIVAGLVAAAAGARIPWGEGRASVVFAVDRSQSIGAAAEGVAARAVEQLASRMRAGDQAGVVVFGADAVVDQPLAASSPQPRPASDVARGGTNIEGAIRVARSTLPGEGLRRIVLLTDGHATSGDATSELLAAARDSISVDVVPLRQQRTANARVQSVVAPAHVTAGEAFDVDVMVSGAPGERAAVSLMRDGRSIHSATTALDARGEALVTVTDRLTDGGVVSYTAATDGRESPEAGAAVTVGGAPSVLYISEAPARISGEEMRIEQRRPADLLDSAAALSRYSVIVLDDVDAETIPPRSAHALAEYINRFGGGLVLRGTPRTLGPAGYPQTALDRVLPVDFRGRGGQRGSELALVVAFDKSGSMADRTGDTTKIEFARRAAVAVHDVLAAGDSLGVIAFDAAAAPAVPLAAKGPADDLRERLRGIAPSGPTKIAPAIRLARAWLEKTSATRRRILLISDGKSDEADAAEVLALLADRRVALTIVAAGDDADRVFFRDLSAKTGADVHFADTLAKLPAIAAREAVKASGGWLVRERFQGRLPAAHPLSAGIDAADLPVFNAYVAAARRPQADAVVESHLGDPIVAAAHAGLGRVVVVTADDVLEDNTGAWPRIWTQAIRWAARPADDTVHVDFEDARLRVDVLTATQKFVNGLRGTAVVRGPGGAEVRLPLQQTAPGRYEAVVVLNETGTYVAAITLRAPDGGEEFSALRGLYRSAPAEMARGDADLDALEAISRAGGGSVIAANTSPFDRARPRAWVDVSRYLAMLALVLVVVEVAVRRGLTLPAWRRRHRLAQPEAL